MEQYSRMVIDLYKKCFTDYKNNSMIDVDSMQEIHLVLKLAIDKAKIESTPSAELELLLKDVEYLKYTLL